MADAGEERRMPANERLQVQQIEALELEKLEEEEVDSDTESHGSGADPRLGRGAGGFTFHTRHAYLGDVDDIRHSRSFLDGGSVVKLPMLYLEGTVLFPEATLPLRVVHDRFKAAVERARHQEVAPLTLGVIHIRRLLAGVHAALVGTTAEIRQIRICPDGSINLIARGRQRFRVQDAWTEADGTPCAEVQIIPEDKPLHIPRDAFAQVAAFPACQSGKVPRVSHERRNLSDESPSRRQQSSDVGDVEDDYDQHDHPVPRLLRTEPITSSTDLAEESSEEELHEDLYLPRWLRRQNRTGMSRDDAEELPDVDSEEESSGDGDPADSYTFRIRGDWGRASKAWASDEAKWMFRAQRTSWPHWVYRMYDAYDLSRRAADMWRQMVELPSMDELVKTPEMLSFSIASKMPLPDSTRQELLETEFVVSRLRREIQLLECMDKIRCKTCKAVIARRSDMLVLSTDGPVNAFVNEHGYVHETLTLRKARGLNLPGRPESEYTWFPGYTWTIAYCVCDTHMGWRFTATKKEMRPCAFWGIRRCQIAAVADQL